jgi:hypothetical protein
LSTSPQPDQAKKSAQTIPTIRKLGTCSSLRSILICCAHPSCNTLHAIKHRIALSMDAHRRLPWHGRWRWAPVDVLIARIWGTVARVSRLRSIASRSACAQQDAAVTYDDLAVGQPALRRSLREDVMPVHRLSAFLGNYVSVPSVADTYTAIVFAKIVVPFRESPAESLELGTAVFVEVSRLVEWIEHTPGLEFGALDLDQIVALLGARHRRRSVEILQWPHR